MKKLIFILIALMGLSASAQTTEYVEFLTKYNADPTWITNVNMLCKLVTAEYTPDPSHTYAADQAEAYEVFNVGSAIKADEFATKTMGEILDIVKGRIKDKIDEEPQEVIDGINGSNITDERKQELIMLIQSPDQMQPDLWWTKMLDYLVEYLVFESSNKKVYCFCERIGMHIE